MSEDQELTSPEVEGEEAEESTSPAPLLEAAYELASSPEIQSAIARYIAAHAATLERKGEILSEEAGRQLTAAESGRRHQERMVIGSLVFGLVIFAALCTMIWHDKLSRELGGTLMGSLIGYWYGRSKEQ